MYNSYLMWIGSDNYKTIEEWTHEATLQGISKRLPSLGSAISLNKPETAIFVAHDEGGWRECEDCVGEIENPVWRKLNEKQEKYAREIEKYEKETPTLRNDKDLEWLARKIFRREEKIKKIDEKMKKIDEYIEGGTGGEVEVVRIDTGQRETLDYRKFNYWFHQPKKFFKRYDLVGEPKMCRSCGGGGKLPETKIFGLFIPSGIEYILKKDDGKAVREEMEKRGFRTIEYEIVKLEEKRRCGYRKEGGYYVVAKIDEKNEKSGEVVKNLIESNLIKPDCFEIKGNFINFITPVEVEGVKRFRGIKKWTPTVGSIMDEAEMIMDALE